MRALLVLCALLSFTLTLGCDAGESLAPESGATAGIVSGHLGPVERATVSEPEAKHTTIEVEMTPERIREVIAWLDQQSPLPVSDAGAVVIDFEDEPAPCLFFDTQALRRYGSVRFRHETNGYGGGILDQCGNFGVDAHSGTNFLAFNSDSGYPGGGVPLWSGQLIGHPRVTAESISFFASGGFDPVSGAVVEAYGENGLIDTVTFDLPAFQWVEVMVQGPGIRFLLFRGDVDLAVIDDITAQVAAPES